MEMHQEIEHPLEHIPSFNCRHPSCVWSVLNIFEFYKRFKVRRLLLNRRRGGDKSDRGARNKSIVPSGNTKAMGCTNTTLHSPKGRSKKNRNYRKKKHTNSQAQGDSFAGQIAGGQHNEQILQVEHPLLQRLYSIHYIGCDDKEFLFDKPICGTSNTRMQSKTENAGSPVSCQNAHGNGSVLHKCTCEGNLHDELSATNIEYEELEESLSQLPHQHDFLQEDKDGKLRMNHLVPSLNRSQNKDTEELNSWHMLNDCEFEEEKNSGSGHSWNPLLGDEYHKIFSSEVHECNYEIESKHRWAGGNGEFEEANPEEMRSIGQEKSENGQLTVSKTVDYPEYNSREATLRLKDNTGRDFGREISLPGISYSRRKKGLRYLKQRIQRAIKGAKKECVRITLDGILHKVPYGREAQSLKHDSEADIDFLEKMSRPSRGDIYRPIKRSASLSESLQRFEKYSQLFESINQHKPKLEHSKTVNMSFSEAKSLVENHIVGRLSRVQSLPIAGSFHNSGCNENARKDLADKFLGAEGRSDQFVDTKACDPEKLSTEGSYCLLLNDVANWAIGSEFCLPFDQDMIANINKEDNDLFVAMDKEKLDFGHVKDVLDKCGIIRSSQVWYKQLDHNMTDRSEYSQMRVEEAMDPMLLNDLIVETLLEVQQRCYMVLVSVLLGWSICPTHAVCDVLTGLWIGIGWHLRLPSQEKYSVEPVNERDFNNEWISSTLELDALVFEFEDCIWDDLLDELSSELLPLPTKLTMIRV